MRWERTVSPVYEVSNNCTAQYSTVICTKLKSMVLHCATHSMARVIVTTKNWTYPVSGEKELYCTVQYSTVICTVLQNTVLHCTTHSMARGTGTNKHWNCPLSIWGERELYCKVQYSVIQFCNVLHFPWAGNRHYSARVLSSMRWERTEGLFLDGKYL